MAVTTVLSPINIRAFADAQLLLQMSRYNSRQLVSDQKLAIGDNEQKIGTAQRSIEQWQNLRGDLSDAEQYLAALVSKVTTLSSYVSDLNTTAYSARNASADIEKYGARYTFDSKLRQLNNVANNQSITPNIVGSQATSSFSYETDIYGATDTLDHQFLGSDYYIIDSGGKRWEVEKTNQLILQQRDTDWSLTGKKADLTTGIQLDSYDTSTKAISFTIQPGTSEELAVSGTLYTSGLEILNSWIYEGLTTTTGRTNALNDLHEAQAQVDVYLALYKAAQAKAGFHDDRAASAITGLSSKVDSLTASQLLALQEVENEGQFIDGINQSLVNARAALRVEYYNLLKTTNPDLTQALVDATV